MVPNWHRLDELPYQEMREDNFFWVRHFLNANTYTNVDVTYIQKNVLNSCEIDGIEVYNDKESLSRISLTTNAMISSMAAD